MICQICNTEIKTNGIGRHIKHTHNINAKDYYDKYLKKDTDGVCCVCGKNTNFNNIISGYKKHCCNSCAQKDPETRKKIRSTNMQRYGYANGNRDLVKEVNLKKYGHSSYLATKECRQALKETNQKLYGYNTPFESKEIQEKVKQTNNQRLGVDYPLANKKVHEKAQANKLADISNYAKIHNKSLLIDLTNLYGWNWLYELDIPYIIYKHVALVDNKYLNDIIEYSKTHIKLPKITKYHRYNSGGKVKSKAELEIIDYIKSIYSGKILNNQKIISPLELDIYLPELQLAIEYNGIYWHSIKHKQKSYHQRKSLACKDKNIRLLHFYEFEDMKDIQQYIYNAIYNLETIDINKPCNLDKDNWKLYEKTCVVDKIIEPNKILDSPEIYNAGQIIYKPIR